MIIDYGTRITVRSCGKVDIMSTGFDRVSKRWSTSDLDEVILILTGIIEEKKKVICESGEK